MKKLIFIFSFLLFSLSLLGDGLFGPEWTFVDPKTFNSYGKEDQWIEEIKKELKKLQQQGKCSSCSVKYDDSLYLTRTKYILIDTDPMVYELNSSAMTVKEFKKYKDILQKLIWDTAKKVGLTVHDRLVGGHIHLDKKTHFGKNKLLMRNFIVDLFNHPHLFLGALSHDYLNAPPLSLLGKKSNEMIAEAILEYDRKDISFDEFLDKIQEAYEYGYKGKKSKTNSRGYKNLKTIEKNGNPKYQAVNLDHDETIEIRGFQPQKSAQHYYDMIRLIEKRIKYLSKFKKPIPFKPQDQYSKVLFKVKRSRGNQFHRYSSKIPSKEILDVYRKYVEQSGLSWKVYKNHLADNRLKNYLPTYEKNRSNNNKRRCSGVF